jgi:hypothetical protein
MSSLVGLYGRLSAAFERFFSGFRYAVGGRYVELAHDVTWGVLLSGSTVLSEIARAIREPHQPLISVEKRLSSGLKCKGWNDLTLADALARQNAREMDERSFVIVDLTDLAKPHAKAMEDLCVVRDGSMHRIVTGFPAVVVLLERAPHDLVPLRVVPFSYVSEGFLSENEAVFSVLRGLKKLFPAGRTGVALDDRGGDGDRFFEFFVEEEWSFIIRLKGDRHVVGPWGAKRADHVALEHLQACPWEGRERACIIPVCLPDVEGQFHLVGYERLHHTRPLFLLVHERVPELVERGSVYGRWYLRRWGAEDWIRLLKQSLGLERFLARSSNARRRLCLAAELALSFAIELNDLDRKWVEELKCHAESFDEELKSELSRLLRGINNVAKWAQRESLKKGAA